MGHLERGINAPTATPARIAKIVAGLPSDAVAGPGTLSPSLVNQLETIGANNGGQVSLHSHPFAQWMHDAFPRECPMPHLSMHPQSADEWLVEHGAENTRASKEDRMEHVERASYEADQMPWNVDAVGQQQCPIPEPYVPEHTQEEDAIARDTPLSAADLMGGRRKISLGSALGAAEEPERTWHMYEVVKVPEQTPEDHTEKPPWHMYETPASHGHPEQTTAPKAAEAPKARMLASPAKKADTPLVTELPRSASPVEAKAPDAEALFHQAYDAAWSEEDEVVPMGKAQLPTFETPSDSLHILSQPTDPLLSEALVSGLQKNWVLVSLTILLSAAVGFEKMRKRNDGWGKRNEELPRFGDVDIGLVRMAAAESVSQRNKPSFYSHMV